MLCGETHRGRSRPVEVFDFGAFLDLLDLLTLGLVETPEKDIHRNGSEKIAELMEHLVDKTLEENNKEEYDKKRAAKVESVHCDRCNYNLEVKDSIITFKESKKPAKDTIKYHPGPPGNVEWKKKKE